MKRNTIYSVTVGMSWIGHSSTVRIAAKSAGHAVSQVRRFMLGMATKIADAKARKERQQKLTEAFRTHEGGWLDVSVSPENEHVGRLGWRNAA